MPTFIEKGSYNQLVSSICESMLTSFGQQVQALGVGVSELDSTDLARDLEDRVRLTLGEHCDIWPDTIKGASLPSPSGANENPRKIALG